MMRGWGAGWWLVGAVFMLFCMVMMVRMMGMGHSGHGGNSGHGGSDEPERTLANRLARGEIDVEEYERLLEALRRIDGTHIATEAAATWRDYAFDTLRLERIVSMVSEQNAASRRVAEKLGMTVERQAMWGHLPHLMYSMQRDRGNGP